MSGQHLPESREGRHARGVEGDGRAGGAFKTAQHVVGQRVEERRRDGEAPAREAHGPRLWELPGGRIRVQNLSRPRALDRIVVSDDEAVKPFLARRGDQIREREAQRSMAGRERRALQSRRRTGQG